MTAIALTCPWCGAPLPRVLPGQPFATCVYCRSTSSIADTGAAKAAQGAGPAVDAADAERHRSDASMRVIEAFRAARAQGAGPYDALVAAARERLGAMGETEAFARVVFALGRDFDAENGTKVVEDPLCMTRFIDTYLLAITSVRASGSYDANMPFLTATADGPKHLRRTLTAEIIAALAARDPSLRSDAARPGTSEAAGATVRDKKKWFWPFG